MCREKGKGRKMARYSFLIKPASSLCNLRCRYCFYADVSRRREIPSYGVMKKDVTERLVQRVYEELKDGDEVSFLFQGGEPTVAGLSYFEDFAAQVKKQEKKVQVHYGLQTNGILLDEKWCAFLRENHFLVGLSLDGAAQFHDENRVDAEGKGTWKRVINAKALLEKAQVPYNILWVLTESTARHPEQVWKFLLSEKISFVQFIPCLKELGEEAPEPWALSPKRFASFYTRLFRLWSEAFLKGNYVSVKFFDDVLGLLAYRRVTACGLTGNCQNQFVVEADGSVYPCDFFVLDRWKLGSFLENSVKELKGSQKAREFISREKGDRSACEGCPYENFCHGGCARMYESLFDNRTGFCGYREFLTQCREPLERVAEVVVRY